MIVKDSLRSQANSFAEYITNIYALLRSGPLLETPFYFITIQCAVNTAVQQKNFHDILKNALTASKKLWWRMALSGRKCTARTRYDIKIIIRRRVLKVKVAAKLLYR